MLKDVIFGAANKIKKKYKGRGICVYLLVSPVVRKKDEDKLYSELSKAKMLELFNGVRVVNRGFEGKNEQWIRVVAPFALFELERKEIEMIYENIYSTLMKDFKRIINKHKYKLVGFSFEIYWMRPEPKNIIPMFKLKNLPKMKLDD